MSVPDPSPGLARPVVTLAAFYGAGGTIVGSRVAELLGVAFLDRGIVTAVAQRLGVPEEAVAESEEPPHGGVGRLLGSLARAGISDAAVVDNRNWTIADTGPRPRTSSQPRPGPAACSWAAAAR
jgi:hypothetical protein